MKHFKFKINLIVIKESVTESEKLDLLSLYFKLKGLENEVYQVLQSAGAHGNVQGDRRYSNGGYAQAPRAGGPLPQRCFEAIGNAK